jgi:hypothetical protein
MKNKLIIIPSILSALMFSGFSCGMGGTLQPGKAYFWTNTNPGTVQHLYIDDSLKGVVPYLPDSLTRPGSATIRANGLALILESGKYDIVIKTDEGHITCEGTLSLKLKSSSKNIGSSWNNNNCKVEVEYQK